MSTKELLALAKKNGGAISAKDYKRLTESNDIKIKKQKNDTPIFKNNENKHGFQFELKLEHINLNTYRFILIGRHYSTNDVNGWLSFGKRNAYKISIKKAFDDFFLINRKLKPKIPFDKAVMYSISYNPSSRDDDGNRITLKPFRDMLTFYGFIKDDKREYFFEYPNFEIIDKTYKTEIVLIRKDKLPKINDFKDLIII